MRIDFSALSTPTMRRKPLFAANGVVATSQSLATQAGLSALKQGGNAVDAALAAAITLTVVEPTRVLKKSFAELISKKEGTPSYSEGKLSQYTSK